MVGNSIAGAIGSILSTPVIAYFIAVWTGTVSGPTNAAFWPQLAPLVLGLLALALLVIPPTRRFIFSVRQPLKRLAVWVLSFRITDARRRNGLLKEGEERALAEIAKRNTKPVAFTIAYVPNSPVNGNERFLLVDYSGLSGSGPMKEIHITAPKEQIVMEDKDGPTVPGDDPDDPYHFSGKVTDYGHLKGIDFRIFWRDGDGYPRWDFYHVRPSGQPLKGVRTGPFGEVTYGELVTSPNRNDGSLTVKWASNQQVMGRLVPSGRAWKVEFGRREGRVKPYFVMEYELGVVSTPAEGVELLKVRALQEEEAQEADGTAG